LVAGKPKLLELPNPPDEGAPNAVGPPNDVFPPNDALFDPPVGAVGVGGLSQPLFAAVNACF
jgi:hypothetical protein